MTGVMKKEGELEGWKREQIRQEESKGSEEGHEEERNKLWRKGITRARSACDGKLKRRAF